MLDLRHVLNENQAMQLGHGRPDPGKRPECRRDADAIVRGRVVSRLSYGELVRLHDARLLDTNALSTGLDASSDDGIECQMREEWRVAREDGCVRKLLSALGQHGPEAFEDAAQKLACLHQPAGTAPGSDVPGAPPLCQSHRQLQDLLQSHLQRSRTAFPRKPAPLSLGAVPCQWDGGAGAPPEIGSVVDRHEWASGIVQALCQRRAVEQSGLLDGLREQMGLNSLHMHRGELVGRIAADRICRCARYWLRVLRPCRQLDSSFPMWAEQGTRWDRAATVIQCSQRQRLARRKVFWAGTFARLRRRRYRKLHWSTRTAHRSLGGHVAAAPVYDGLAAGAWHVAKEKRRIEREEQRERKVFVAAFKAWDRKMTRMVMAKPLHEDWVPQMFANNDLECRDAGKSTRSGHRSSRSAGGTAPTSSSTGQPTGYYNVRTQVRLPFHPARVPQIPMRFYFDALPSIYALTRIRGSFFSMSAQSKAIVPRAGLKARKRCTTAASCCKSTPSVFGVPMLSTSLAA